MLNLLKIRIQNYRNLKDVTIDLKDVHLFIGPNNSGKSNVLKAIRLGSMIVGKNLIDQNNSKYRQFITNEEYRFLKNSISITNDELCTFSFLFQLEEETFAHLLIEQITNIESFIFGIIHDPSIFETITTISDANIKLYDFCEIDMNRSEASDEIENFSARRKFKHTSLFINTTKVDNTVLSYNTLIEPFLNEFINLPIYEISPKEMRSPYGTTGDKFISNDGSNIVSFLDSMKSHDDEVYPNLKKTLSLITKDFSGFYLDVIDSLPEDHRLRLRFPTSTIKKFGLIDSRNKENTIWAESLSDGILYFLAILCIVHQPNPPAIVLIEEPEKGIHPRRIKEVMDLLFALADEKKIQIILTTHSTFVVNEFKDLPENISVFENTDSVITIQNLKTDIIKKLESDIENQGYEKVDFTDSLGENWALGLLGGVPI